MSDVFYVGGGTTDDVVKENGITNWHRISSLDDIASITVNSPNGLKLVPSKYRGVVGDVISADVISEPGYKTEWISVNGEKLSGRSFRVQKGGVITLEAGATQTSATPETGNVGPDASYWYADSECHINGSGETRNYASTMQTSASTLRPSPLAGRGDFQRVYIEPGITSIGAGLLYSAYNVREIYISSGVTQIGGYAFQDLINLEQISIPASVKSIENRVFFNCMNLHDVYFGGTEEEWNELSIGSENDALRSATIHYQSSASNLPLPDSATGKKKKKKIQSSNGTVECQTDISCALNQPSAIFVGARYSEEGQYLGMHKAELSAGQTSQITFAFDQANYIKLYMIDARTFAPLCEAVTVWAK